MTAPGSAPADGSGGAALDGVREGLSTLRGVLAPANVLAQGTDELCRACGFARALLFTVEEDRLVPAVAVVSGRPETATALMAALRTLPLPLHALPLEKEMLRRRRPLLVADVAADPRVHACLRSTWGSTAYVAAPLLPQGDVIGILYADRAGQDLAVGDGDRATVATYAEGLGFAFQAAALHERLRTQQQQVDALLRSTETLFDEFLEEERRGIDDARSGRAAHHATSFLHGAASRLEQVLTPREIEVVRLLAAGEGTSGIAGRLVISEATVNFHVRHILRKLRAGNRAEAVARYLRITAVDRQP